MQLRLLLLLPAPRRCTVYFPDSLGYWFSFGFCCGYQQLLPVRIIMMASSITLMLYEYLWRIWLLELSFIVAFFVPFNFFCRFWIIQKWTDPLDTKMKTHWMCMLFFWIVWNETTEKKNKILLMIYKHLSKWYMLIITGIRRNNFWKELHTTLWKDALKCTR